MAEADKLGLIDPSKVGAIGFCAGGGFALEQARAGANFKGVVVFHVTNPNPVVPGTPCNIKGRVLAIHGRADPVTPKPMMDALEDELTKAKVDWHIVTFGRGVHSFCDPTANNPAATMYDERLCRTSYMLMRDFFAETLGRWPGHARPRRSGLVAVPDHASVAAPKSNGTPSAGGCGRSSTGGGWSTILCRQTRTTCSIALVLAMP